MKYKTVMDGIIYSLMIAIWTINFTIPEPRWPITGPLVIIQASALLYHFVLKRCFINES